MSDVLDDIKTQLGQFAAKHGPAVILPAEVISINEVEATVHIKFSDDSEIEDARLKSVVSGDAGFYGLPTVGSIVQVAKIENSDEVTVVAMSAIDKIVMKKGSDSLGSLLSSLIDEIQNIYAPKDTAAITIIQTKINNLLK